VFRARDVLSQGLLSRDALRSSAWRPLFRGVYADADLADSVGLRIRGARLIAPASAIFSGRTAAYLHGATGLADIREPVEVSVPPGVPFGPVAGLRVRRVSLPDDDLTGVATFRCTTGLRTALDIARTEPVLDAVPALDVLLARGIVGLGELREAGAALTSVRGARRARQATALADPRAESPPESRLRVLLTVAGLAPVPQYTVRDEAGAFVARVDLAFPDLRVAVEYDGLWHSQPQQLGRDRRRLNRLVGAGWTVLHVTAADLYDMDALIAGIKALIAVRECGEVGP
jgi:very-short-patch-repair endonuclease